MVVQRCWNLSNAIQKTDTTTFLEIWDGGSIRYERWPDGTECCWEVVSRCYLSDSSFTEILREIPSWKAPLETMWIERVPLYVPEGDKEFQIPGWSIVYYVVPADMPRHKNPRNIRHKV